MQARTPPPVVMLVPPPPPRVAIPVSLPEQPVVEPEPDPPAAAPTAPARPRPETTPARTVERPAPPAAPAVTADPPATVLQTTTNVGALEQRASWLLGQAEKDLARVNRGQLIAQERAQFDLAWSFIRNARNALRIKNFSYAEQLADKAFKLARALVKA
jgi:hypothetical protein